MEMIIKLSFGNAEMTNKHDAKKAISEALFKLDSVELESITKIRDENGNTVGTIEIKKQK